MNSEKYLIILERKRIGGAWQLLALGNQPFFDLSKIAIKIELENHHYNSKGN